MGSLSENQGDALLPEGSWDCHHHIFDPAAFAYSPTRHLTVPPATVSQYAAFKKAHGITNSVLTHGLSYGADNSSLLAFLEALNKEGGSRQRTLGVAVIDPDATTDEELERLRAGGVRGIRVNLYHYGALEDADRQVEVMRAHARRLQAAGPRTAGWSMAFTTTKPQNWARLRPLVENEIVATGVRLVTDHFALLQVPELGQELDLTQPGLEHIVALMRAGALWVKLSAPYRQTRLPPSGGFADLKPLVRLLVDANPRRVIWGSDWPHTPKMRIRTPEEALQEVPFLEVDDGAWIRALRSWLSDEEWDYLMVKNPRELYSLEA